MQANGKRPQVSYIVLAAPASETTESALNRMLPALKDRGPDWQQTPIESGKIGNLTFCGCEHRGTAAIRNAQNNRVMEEEHQVSFATRANDTTVVLIICFGLPKNEAMQELLLTSALTFRKKQ